LGKIALHGAALQPLPSASPLQHWIAGKQTLATVSLGLFPLASPLRAIGALARSPGASNAVDPNGTSVLTPDALLIPALGVGSHGDTLGYGGGYFDRTLAALHPKPLAMGLAFELSRIATIVPQPHDVLMDFIVTEGGIEAAVAGGLMKLSAEDCRARLAALAAERGLSRRESSSS
jgi:hypothetical protein